MNNDTRPPLLLQESSLCACSCAARTDPRNDAPEAECPPHGPAVEESESGKRLVENRDPREIVCPRPSVPNFGSWQPPAAHPRAACVCFPAARTPAPAPRAVALAAVPTECHQLRREKASPHWPARTGRSSAPPLRSKHAFHDQIAHFPIGLRGWPRN